jgi:hypothetical protein
MEQSMKTIVLNATNTVFADSINGGSWWWRATGSPKLVAGGRRHVSPQAC